MNSYLKGRWSETERDEWLYNYLLDKFGPGLKKPMPEDFGLDGNNLPEAQEAHAKNQKIKTHNRRIGYARYFFGSVLFPFDGKDINPLGEKYENYQKKLSEYDEKEISEVKEKHRILEIKRKEIGYWFSLSGWEFEEEVSKLFLKSGLFTSVVKTKGSGDGGIDLILTFSDGSKMLVQCKAHKKQIGPHVARDLYGAMHAAGISEGLIIGLGGFTQGVRDFIKGKELFIWDVNSIIKFQKGDFDKKLIEK